MGSSGDDIPRPQEDGGAIRRERDFLKEILDSMEEGVYLVNGRFEIRYFNKAVEREFGPVSGRRCHEYFQDLPLACPGCRDGEGRAPGPGRREWRSPNTGKTYELTLSPLPGQDASPSRLGVFRDATERRKVEEALRDSESRYRTLVETMSDGLLVQDEGGRLTYGNDKACEILGYPREEIIGRPATDFLDPVGRDIYREQMLRRQYGEAAPYELPWRRKDGQSVFTLVSPRAFLDGQGRFRGSFAVLTDITERKRMEACLRESKEQIRSLSLQLLESHEAERKRISKELHDELGQALAVLKLNLRFVEGQMPPEQAELREECQKSLEYIDETIENVRRLSRDLSPSALEELGLSAALQRLFHDFHRSFEVRVAERIPGLDGLFPPPAQILIYRLFQEAFTNIIRHARAQQVSVRMARKGGEVSFEVQDDGRGFDPDQRSGKEGGGRGMGLSAMAARARMLGGRLEVRSREGKGTRVRFRLPVPPNGNPG